MKMKVRLFAALCALSSLAAAQESDSRTVVPLSEPHRAQVLAEMRQFLSGLAELSAALAKDDMKTVARVAHSLGSPMTHHVPADLKQAMPEDFRKLGFAVHADFDQIALDAEELGDARHTLTQLGETLSKCVACHNTYQLRAEGGP